MAIIAMMFQFILETNELKAREMYQNLHNFVERTAMQQAQIDR
jgi:hypothetical protein